MIQKNEKIGKQKIIIITKIIRLTAVFLRRRPNPRSGLTERKRQKILWGEEASFSLSSLPLSHLCPSPPLNPAACGGKTNRVHPVAAAPRGLGGAFWKVIPAHCSGLKCCHAELVPNCFAATPPPPPPALLHQPSTNPPASNRTYTVYGGSLFRCACV